MNSRLFSQYRIDIKKLIRIATPIGLAQLAQTGMGTVDVIMAGRVSSADVGGVGIGASIWLPLVLFGQGLLLALPPTISYLNGSGQRHRIAHQARQGLWISFLVMIPLALIIYHNDFILQFMSMDAHMADVTMNYLRAMVWGLPAYLLLINFRCLNDGIAKTKPAMVITFVGLMLNIPLNYMFIYGKFGAPALGGVGCGVATAIVNWAMAILMIIYSAKNYNERSLKVFEKIIEKPDIKTLKKLTALGLPIAIALCSEVSLFALSSLLLSPLGADVVASHQIALNTSAVAFMFPMSIAMAATILVAQELGNHAPKKAKIMAYAAIILGLIAASVLALVIWVFSAEIAALIVGDNATVIALSGSLLAMAAIYQFSDSVQVVVSGILRGYKDTKIILYITLLAYWGVGIPVGYILSRTDWIVPSIGAKGFWVAFIIALTIAAALLFMRMRKIQSQPDEAIIQQLERLK